MFAHLNFAFSITGPILMLLGIGWCVRYFAWVDTTFINQANTLVFNIAMPAMLFLAISSRSFDEAINPMLTLVGLFGTLMLVGLLIVAGRIIPHDQRGVFVQGSYRGNLAVLGVALAVATYGDNILSMVALYIGVITTAYNIIAVWLLDSSHGVFNKLIKNPILMGIVAGTLASLMELPIPVFIHSTGKYLSDLTLPLALLCIGATLEFSSLRGNGRFIALVVFFKLIFSPLLLVSLGLLVGLDNVALGVLFFMAASPTATASYIMARQLTSHGTLAAEIVAVTTAVGVLIYTAGLAVLRSSNLI